MQFSQSNIRQGAITLTSAADYTGKEGFAVFINSSGYAAVPTALTDLPIGVIINVIDTTTVQVEPFTSGKECRIACGAGSSTIVAGSQIVCYGGTLAGQAVLRSTTPAYVIGIAEEAYSASGQFMLVRPALVYIPTTP